MSDKASVFSTGGGGTNFEQFVQTAFLTTLIVRGNSPCIPNNQIEEIAFQTRRMGYETDDLFVKAKSQAAEHRLIIQIKHDISFTLQNAIFTGVIAAFWKDFSNPKLFDTVNDKIIIVKNGLTKGERNHVKSLLNWAKTHATEADFFKEVNRIENKKEVLEVFSQCLKEANKGVALKDVELYKFLKCLDILEYDFLQQSSVDESYFLNLIKLSKNSSTGKSEKDIWNAIYGYVAKANKDGASITIQSVQNEEIYRDFDVSKLNPFFNSVEKLQKDSQEILRPLKNKISEFHLDRQLILEKLLNSLNSFQFTIVTGEPGVGKSAIVKELIENELLSSKTFVFRADQFSVPHLANVFSNQGINETLQDIFSCISLIPEKLIFIDSIEKLLEADPQCAFKQLIELVKEYPDIKIVGSARKYAVDLLAQKFDLTGNFVNLVVVDQLTDEELARCEQAFPNISQLFKNNKIRNVLRSPKYLEFAIKSFDNDSNDYSGISVAEFKEKLWNNLVKDITNRTNGFPAKRENAFMEIAVKRAKEMKLFTKPEIADFEAIDLLEKDAIIFQEGQTGKYSPTHDILEDWALVKHVTQKYEIDQKPSSFFKNLGNEPAIRRSFRLWVEDRISYEDNYILKLVKDSLVDTEIEKYWADELLIAIFKSENCDLFFSSFESELLNNEGELLGRCLHLLRTSCMESNLGKGEISVSLPIGSGWYQAITFIKRHINSLEKLSLIICNLLFDWHFKLLLQTVTEAEKREVKEIVLFYVNKIETEYDNLPEGLENKVSSGLIPLLFNLTSVAKQEITELVHKATEHKKNRGSWKLNSFYQNVIEKCLVGIGNNSLVKELPELIIDTAWKEWQLKKEVVEDDSIGKLMRKSYSRLSGDDCWGIKGRHDFFPPSIYKTPFYNLLLFHPFKALEFITKFINYSIDFYIKADCEYKREFEEIEIRMNDGSIIKQWSNWDLWAAYRGITIPHYAINSLLMSLEKYLLHMASRKTERSRENLKFVFDYLLQNSNNVSTTSILISVASAYPLEVGEELIPLLTVKDFYSLDLTRSLQESSVLITSDSKIPISQQERSESKALPHRSKYQRGLMDFIINYQFNIRELNEKVWAVFDDFKNKLSDNDDIIWKKTLTEIDIRNHQLGEYNEAMGGYLVVPKYDNEIQSFIDSSAKEFEEDGKSLNFSGVLHKTYAQEEKMTIENWRQCYTHYSIKKESIHSFDYPVTLAVIGLRDFKEILNANEEEWCIKRLQSALEEIVSGAYNGNAYQIRKSYNILEKDIALSSFHYLLGNKDKVNLQDVITLMIYVLLAPFSEYEIDKITKYTREVIFNLFPVEAKLVWICMIMLSKFKKENPLDYRDEKAIENTIKAETEFLKGILSSNEVPLNVDELSIDNFEEYILARAFVIIPYCSMDEDLNKYTKWFIPNLTEALKLEDQDRYRGNSTIQYRDTLDCEFYIAEFFLQANLDFSKHVLDLITDPVYLAFSGIKHPRGRLFDFSSKTLEFTIKVLDTTIAETNDMEKKKQVKDNFWKLWHHLYLKVKASGKNYFYKELLLNIAWRKDALHWEPLEGMQLFYQEMAEGLENVDIQPIVNVFSTIGEQTFLPDGISWLVNLYKKPYSSKSSLATLSAERLIKRLFYNHILSIKSNKKLIEDFIWILDNMVDLGSSEAYLFRENVITYKSTT